MDPETPGSLERPRAVAKVGQIPIGGRNGFDGGMECFTRNLNPCSRLTMYTVHLHRTVMEPGYNTRTFKYLLDDLIKLHYECSLHAYTYKHHSWEHIVLQKLQQYKRLRKNNRT